MLRHAREDGYLAGKSACYDLVAAVPPQRKVDSWWVMRAPTGHDFCVICPQGEGSVESARSWED